MTDIEKQAMKEIAERIKVYCFDRQMEFTDMLCSPETTEDSCEIEFTAKIDELVGVQNEIDKILSSFDIIL